MQNAGARLPVVAPQGGQRGVMERVCVCVCVWEGGLLGGMMCQADMQLWTAGFDPA